MKRIFDIAILLIAFCFSAKADTTNIAVSAKLDSNQILIGQQVHLTLSATFPSGDTVLLPTLKDSVAPNVVIVSATKTDTAFNRNNLKKETLSRTYTITAFDSGYYAIPPFKFIHNKDTLESKPLLLTVKTVPVDTTKAIKTIKAPLSVDYTFMDWFKDNYKWILLGVAIILLIILIVWYVRKKLKKKPIKIEKPKIVIPAHIEALKKLEEIEGKKLWQSGAIKDYYSEVTDTLRRYLERRYTITAMEKTTDEVMQSLRMKPINEEHKDNLHGLLRLADLVKFAKEKPVASENEQCIKTARQFVNKTKVEEIKTPENKQNGTVE